MIKYSNLRNQNYKTRRKIELRNSAFDIQNWKKNPYSSFKAIIYIELSSIFAFLIQFTNLSANHVSLLYCISGVVGGLLLMSNNETMIFGGLLLFFLKGSLDWTDGFVARIKKQGSAVGHLLDTWGSHIGNISLMTSVGIYCYNTSANNIFLFLTIIILFLNLIDFKLFTYHQAFYEILNKKIKISSSKKKLKIKYNESISIQILKNFMDHRARTVDTICLLLLLEIVYNLNYFSKIILILYFVKTILFFLGYLYLYLFKEKMEKQIK